MVLIAQERPSALVVPFLQWVPFTLKAVPPSISTFARAPLPSDFCTTWSQADSCRSAHSSSSSTLSHRTVHASKSEVTFPRLLSPKTFLIAFFASDVLCAFDEPDEGRAPEAKLEQRDSDVLDDWDASDDDDDDAGGGGNSLLDGSIDLNH